MSLIIKLKGNGMSYDDAIKSINNETNGKHNYFPKGYEYNNKMSKEDFGKSEEYKKANLLGYDSRAIIWNHFINNLINNYGLIDNFSDFYDEIDFDDRMQIIFGNESLNYFINFGYLYEYFVFDRNNRINDFNLFYEMLDYIKSNGIEIFKLTDKDIKSINLDKYDKLIEKLKIKIVKTNNISLDQKLIKYFYKNLTLDEAVYTENEIAHIDYVENEETENFIEALYNKAHDRIIEEFESIINKYFDFNYNRDQFDPSAYGGGAVNILNTGDINCYFIFLEREPFVKNCFDYSGGVKNYIDRIEQLMAYLKINMKEYRRININKLNKEYFDDNFNLDKFDDIVNEK